MLVSLLLKFFIVLYVIIFGEEEVFGVVIYFDIFLEVRKFCFFVGKSFNIVRF